jgi:membrane protein implicated in regulation of membrane protease activity
MGLDATARRRWFGAIVLTAALLMLIAGETVLQGRLKELGFLLYWALCFGFTCLSIIVAFLDVRALGRRTRQEQRDLLESTLKKIQRDARDKRKGNRN